ncbi:Spore germination protein A2 [Paenibacillus konkukensis]|uniref:Spore germination protein A2 n=1 Tax=Paenibacillus konkukensis TaxID=2020716 RepID=A0ABY4RMS7_9BACL|nr:endospore germination permease [Paenibacillus konkukensis]UQZ83245.1 Spore germination protein A2 [Paenibacillus konkukensis]
MDNNQRSLNLQQLFTLFMLSSGLMDHVIVMPFLLGISGRSGWITVVLVGVLLTCWLPLLTYVIKKTKMQPLFLWMRQRYGPVISALFQIPMAVYLFALGTTTLVDTVVWVKSMFLPETPVWFIAFSFMGVCVWATYSGIRTIARCGVFLLPLVVVFGMFVSVANIPRKHYDHLLPLLENGMGPVFEGMFIVGGGLIEVVMVLLMQHHLKAQPKFSHMLLTLWVLVGLTSGPLVGAIAEFGPAEAAHLRYPAYEEWRLVRIGHYVEHVDFLSIFQWLSGGFIRISLALFLLKDMLRSRSLPGRGSMAVVAGLGCLMTIAVLLPFSDKDFVAFLNDWYFTGAVTVALLFSAGVTLLVWFKKQERSGST